MRLLRRGEHLSDRDLFELVEGELPPNRSKSLWGHVSRCRECKQRLAEWTEAQRMVATVPVLDAPGFVIDRVRQRISEPELPRVRAETRPVPLAPVVAAAAAVLVFVTGYGLYSYRQNLRDSSARHATRMEQRPRPPLQASGVGKAPATVDWGSATATASGEPSAGEVRVAAATPRGRLARPAEKAAARVAPRQGPAEPTPRPTEAEPPAARLESFSGTPVLVRGDTIRNADAGAPLAPGDTLRTDDTDRAFIELHDGGQMVVSFDTELELPGAASARDEPGFSAELLKGQVWAWSPGDGEGITITTANGSGRIHRGEALVRFFGPQAVPLTGRGNQVEVVAFGGRVQFADLEGKLTTVKRGEILLADREPKHLHVEPAASSWIIRMTSSWGKGEYAWEMHPLSSVQLLSQLDAPRMGFGARLVPVGDAEPGLQVASVPAGSNAGKAGVLTGDVILQIGEVPITTVRDVAAAELLLAEEARPTVVVRRGDTEAILELPPIVTAPELCEPTNEGVAEAAALAAGGDVEEAANTCLRLATEEPTCAAHWYNLGLLREYQGGTSEALAAYKEARSARPTAARILTALGRAYGRLGNFARAEAALREAEATHASATTRYLLGRTAVPQGDLLGAEDWSNKLLLSASTEDQAWGEILAGLLALVNSDHERAARRFESATALDAGNLEAAYYSAVAAYAGAQLGAARDLLRPLLRVWPDLVRAINLMGSTAYQLEEYNEARSWFARGLALRPGTPVMLCNLGYISFAEGKPEEAIRYYKEAIEADPSFRLAHMRLGEAAAEAGTWSLAADHYQQALRLSPGDPKLLAKVIDFYQERGEQEQVDRLLRRYEFSALSP